MKGLLYKDFYLLKGGIIFIAVFQLLISGTCILLAGMNLGESMTMVLLILCYYLPFLVLSMVNQQLFAQDERCSWYHFVGSTPQSISGQIAGKYYMILIENLILLLFCYYTDAIVVLVSDGAVISLAVIGMYLFCIRLFLQAIETPFLVRFGANVGGSVKGALLTVIAFIVICYGLFGDISFLFGDDPVAAFMNFLSSDNILWILAAFPYVAVVSYYLSYKISVRVYKEGVTYE